MNPTKFLQETVETVNKLIESLSSAETTTDTNTTDTTTTPADRDDTQQQQLEKLRNNLNQIKEFLIQLQNFEESDLAKQLQTHLRVLEAKFGTVREKNEQALSPNPNAPSSSPKVLLSGLPNINKELMKIKYQIPSIRKLSMTSSKAHSQAGSGSDEGSSVQELPKLHVCESIPKSSFYNEIKGIFDDLKEEEKFILSRFAVLTEGAVVKRRLLTYWGLGVDYLSESKTKEKTPEEFVDNILEKLQEMGFIEPAMGKRKQKVRSYKMDPLVRSAMIKIYEKKKSDGDFNGNAVGYRTTSNKTFFVKGEEKFLYGKSPSQEGEDQSQNLDPEKLGTLFNVNEHSPETQLNDLAKKTSKDIKVVDWLSKMKSLEVLYLGRWQKSAGYHIEVKDTAFLKGLKNMEKLKFLSLQGISRINKLPRSIGMLKKLVVLDLKDCYNLEELSREISSLTNLRYLDISNCYLLGNMPKELSSLSELQVLKGFIVGDQQRNLGTLEGLKELKKLKKLTIIATRNDFPTPTDLVALLKLEALRNLTIAWGVQPKNAEAGKSSILWPSQHGISTESSQHGISTESSQHGTSSESSVRESKEKLSKNLEKLDLQCFPYSTPTWLTPDDLPELEKLYIRGGNFTTLKKGTWKKVKALRFKYLSAMKWNWRALKESFPELVYLERVKCPGITLCPCDENGVWQNPKT